MHIQCSVAIYPNSQVCEAQYPCGLLHPNLCAKYFGEHIKSVILIKGYVLTIGTR